MRIRIGFIVCHIAMMGGLGAVSAGEVDPETKALYEAGSAHFEAGRFEEALDAFTEVYNRTVEPKLLFNLGAAAEGMGDRERAAAYYRVYLEELPDAADADEVRARIAYLTGGTAPEDARDGPLSGEQTDGAETEQAPATLQSPSVDAETFYSEKEQPKELGPVWQSTTLGVGGMILVGGIISASVAKSRYDGLSVACSPDCSDAQVSSARGPAIAADVLFAVGGLAVTAGTVGLVLYLRKKKKAETAVRLVPAVSPDGAFIGAEGRF